MNLIKNSTGGLGDRIIGIVNAVRIADVNNRNLIVLWKKDHHCPINFSEILKCSIPVVDKWDEKNTKTLVESEIKKHKLDLGRFKKDVLYNCSLGCNLSKAKLNVYPSDIVKDKVEHFKDIKFKSNVVGVHIRRADRLYQQHQFATALDYFYVIDNYFKEHKIFLATDDGAIDPDGNQTVVNFVRKAFLEKYGDRIIMYPVSTLDRRLAAGVFDATVILYLLRETECLIGSYYSGFSLVAALEKKYIFPLKGWHKLQPTIDIYNHVHHM